MHLAVLPQVDVPTVTHDAFQAPHARWRREGDKEDRPAGHGVSWIGIGL